MATDEMNELKVKLSMLENLMGSLRSQTELLQRSKEKEYLQRNVDKMELTAPANIFSHSKLRQNFSGKEQHICQDDNEKAQKDTVEAVKAESFDEPSSESLSKLAKEIWNRKGNPRLLNFNAKVKKSDHFTCNMKKNDFTFHKAKAEASQQLTKVKTDQEEHNSSEMLVNNATLAKFETPCNGANKKEKLSSKMMKEKCNEGCNNIKQTDSGSGSNSETEPLAFTSEMLSKLAKETWKNSTTKNSSYFQLRNIHESSSHNSSLTPQLRVSSTKRQCAWKNSVFKLNNSPQVKFNEVGAPTDDYLSELARCVWKQKVDQRGHSFKKSIKQNYSLIQQKNSQIQNSSLWMFKWKSGQDNHPSFLHRRRQFILRNSQFKMVKIPLTEKRRNKHVKPDKFMALNFARRRQYYLSSKRKDFVSRPQTLLYQKAQGANKWIANSTKESYGNSTVDTAQKSFRKVTKTLPIIFTSVSGKKFITDAKGRSLRRASSSSSGLSSETALKGSRQLTKQARTIININKYKVIRRQNSFPSHSSKLAASRFVKKRLARFHQKNIRKYVRRQYCIFYNRFGKCKSGDTCKYIHDPEKVAVCTRFLRGTCKDDKCLFSHKVDKSKMPTCSFFLNGSCHREDCPYRHVKVSRTAAVCKDFLKGYCPLGEKCMKRHVLECEEFSKHGSCMEGQNCKLHHRKQNLKRKRSSSISGTKTPRPFLKKTKIPDSKEELATSTDSVVKEVQIKPSFALSNKSERTSTGLSRSKRKRRFNWRTDKEDSDTKAQ